MWFPVLWKKLTNESEEHTASIFRTVLQWRRQVHPNWGRILLEKLTGFQQVKKFPMFFGTRRSLPHSKVPTNRPYPKSAPSSPYPHIPLPEDSSYSKCIIIIIIISIILVKYGVKVKQIQLARERSRGQNLWMVWFINLCKCTDCTVNG
jgi:hypothetical protein